tara:strand:- start:126 stop:452 length:327 start_codon:yes stop_codon:yes gene_type:complete
MNFLFGLSWLVFAALFVPIDLPAGGLSLNKLPSSQSTKSNILFAGSCCDLFKEPVHGSQVASHLEIGTPLKIIRSWSASDGHTWYQVQQIGLAFLDSPGHFKRGWLHV